MITTLRRAPAWIRHTVLALALLGATPAFAGLPVLDYSNLIQALVRYETQLRQYSEALSQTALGGEQLQQQIALYKQALSSYNEVLRQMEGLKNALDPQDYNRLFANFKDVLNTSPSAPGYAKARDEVGLYYSRGQSMDEVASSIDQLPVSSQSRDALLEQSNQLQRASDLATSQRATYDGMSRIADDRVDRLNKVEEDRASLGPEDHLKTLQVMAEQNSLMLDTMQQQVQQNNAQLLYSNQLENRIAAQRNEDQAAKINEMRMRLSEDISIRNRAH